MEDLRFASIHSVREQPGAVDDALAGTFWLAGEAIELVSPVDWWEAPYRAGERAFFQNSFVFADPVLSASGFEPALPSLAALFADWVRANPAEAPPHPHRYAWHDHAAAGRLVYLAFVLREGMRRGTLDEETIATLAAGVLEHADYLLDEEHHASTYNHGLFSDAALALAARSLMPAPPTEVWTREATRRFADVLAHTIAPDDAVHLEHSPYYHWVIHGALSRFAEAGLFSSLDLAATVSRMEESGAWLVAPDGTLPPLGDTPPGRRPPTSVGRVAAESSGLGLLGESGYAVVRERDSCLVVTAAHHPTAHKHADDGSFCLYEDGLPIVIDSGDPGHDYGTPERRHGASPQAHATLTVDGHDWVDGGTPYGSGIRGADEDGGRHAILVANPNAVPGGGEARRAFVYEPGRFLLVLDFVEAGSERTLARHLPLAPDLEATVEIGGGVAVSRDGRRVARLVSFVAGEGEADGVEVSRGVIAPEWSGLMFPGFGEWVPRSTVTFSGTGGAERGLLIALGDGLDPEPEPRLLADSAGGRLRVQVTGVGENGPIGLAIGADSVELSGGES